MAIIKKKYNNKCGLGVEKLEVSALQATMQNEAAHLENSFTFPQIINVLLPYHPTISLLNMYLKGIANRYLHKTWT